MYDLTIENVLKTLNTSPNGLSQHEAEQRLKQYGLNEIEKGKKQSFIKTFFRQFLNIMVVILLFAAMVSLIVAVVNGQYSDLFEGFVILFIVIMNAFIGVFQELKAQSCIEELQKYDKTIVKVYRSGIVAHLESTQLVCGDIIEMEAGNIVPADIRLINCNNFACDESSLTGESVAIDKDASLVLDKSTALAERVNMAFSGSVVTKGKARGVVISTGKETEIGKIAKMLFGTKKETTPLQKSIDKIGKIITWVVVAVSLAIMIAELIAGHSLMDSVMTSVSLAVAAIPESLPAVITIIMALGVQQLARKKCVIRHLHAVETLGSCEVICTDKTGTLTQNKMEVVELFVKGDQFDSDLLKCMAQCNSANIINGKIEGEPTEKALLEFVVKHNRFNRKKIIHEIPFSSERKMMTVYVVDDGVKSYSKGAPEILINKCKYIKINNDIVPLSDDIRKDILNQNNQMADKALRVIGFAYRDHNSYDSKVLSEEEMVFLGFVGLRDNPRPEVKESVKRCFKAGLVPIMITGDHKRTAFAIAKEIGIANSLDQVITGEELNKMTDKELQRECYNYRVYARVSPEHKVRIVKAYKKLNKVVAMTGDGVNDAPSLKVSDIGVGMGKSGTDVVKSVADMLVTDDNFSSIIVAVEEGRKVYSNIQKALQFLISTNCVEVFGMLISLLFFPQFTFLLPSQMLFINLVSDSLPAFALGVEKVEKDVMLNPPRNPKAGLFSGAVGVAIVYQSILQVAIVFAVFLIGVFCYTPDVASTMVFFTIIFMQLLHSVNCKTNKSIFEKKLFDNKTFNICFLITLAINLIVASVPFMYTLFNLEFLNFSQWIVVAIASIIIIPSCELMKAILGKENYQHEKNNKKYLKNQKILQKNNKK